MAKLRFPNGVSFCAFFILLLLRISSGVLQTGYYTYELDEEQFSSNDRPSIEFHRVRRSQDEIAKSDTSSLFQTAHSVQERETNLQQPENVTTKTTNIPTSPSPTPKAQQNNTLQVPLARIPLNFTITQNASLLLQPSDISLGENGTGIRKISTTQVPLVMPTSLPTELSNLNTSIYEPGVELPDVNDTTLEETLKEHNISIVKQDTHLYYNSTFSTNPEEGMRYWVDLSNVSNVKVDHLLSNSYRRAVTVKLSFDFPFYGHLIRNITIATGGFVYTGDYVHSWLAATQYIAPLMANFDTSISNRSLIKHYDNGTAFTVEWHQVYLQDKPDEGAFTFQATLLNTGDMIFVYKSIPLFIEKIRDDQHPVKVGLSDAYIMDNSVFFVRRKTIYEYHRINFHREDIRNYTVIYLKALSTCLQYDTCTSCLAQEDSPAFECRWCPAMRRCSDGLHRFRQEWLERGCDRRNLSSVAECAAAATTSDDYRASAGFNRSVQRDDDRFGASHQVRGGSEVEVDRENIRMGVSGIVAIIFIITTVSGLAAWVFYAYRNPHTTSGQILIRYRPSQWRWSRSEPRYTVATIHM